MTSHREEKIIIAENGVVTEEALLAYLGDKLPVEDRQEVERLVKDDPFAQDALEGLKASQNKAAIADSLASIHKKIHERVDAKERKIIGLHWSNYAWAAVIVGLLISLGSITIAYFGKHNENLATNDKVETITPAEQKTEQPGIVPAPVQTKDTVATAQVTKEEEKPAVKTTEPVENKKKPEITENKTVTPSSGTTGAQNLTMTNTKAGDVKRDANQEIVQVTQEKKAKKNEAPQAITNNNASPDKKENTNKAAEVVAETRGGTTTTTLAEAKNTFNTGDYKKSAVEFEEVLKQQPDDAEALFFGGVSEYVNGDLQKSEKNFDQLLARKKKFVDGAKWYKSSILLKKGDKDQAKKLLNELSQSNGSYKERATKKLAELEPK